MITKNELKEASWLKLLKEAINSGAKIQVNHRYKYKGKNLGTFLVSAKSKNNVELTKKIENLGFNFKLHSRKPNDYVEKYITQLSEDKTPNKQQYITRFNLYVFPKKDLLKKQTINKLNRVWKSKFGDVRKWKKPATTAQKVERWKAFRYDEEKNPDGKWFYYRKYMGDNLYGWVYVRKRDENKMNLILDFFNKKELTELKKEGFLTK